MHKVVRTLIFNVEEECSTPLRQHLLSIEGVKIVAEVDEPALVGQAVQRFPADLLIAHLDPDPAALLPVAAQVAKDHPGLAVFAISARADGELILVALRAGLREFLIKPVDPEQLAEAIAKVRDQQADGIQNGQLITVMGSVGGAGATMLASNLAVELKQTISGQVAVVDLDFRFGQLATCFDLVPTYTIADLCETPEQLDQQMIEKAMHTHESGVRVLARPGTLVQADQITAAHSVSVLASLQETYEYVIVDGPCRFDTTARAVLDLADLTLLVVQLVVPSVRNAHRILEEFSSRGHNMERVKVVCNRHGRQSGHLEARHVSTTLNREMYALIPDDWDAVSEAINIGAPLLTSDPRSRVRLAVKKLAAQIRGDDGNDESDKKSGSKAGGVLSKLFS